MSDIEQLEADLNAYQRKLIKSLSPQRKRQAERKIVMMLTRNMNKRLTAQKDIQGQSFQARKQRKPGQKAKMLTGFKNKAWLRTQFEKDKITVGYKGGNTAKTAQVHNEGLTQKLKNKDKDVWVNYPARQWVGFSAEDKAMIQDVLEDFLLTFG